MRRTIIVLTALALSGCVDQKAWVQKFVPKDDDVFARKFVELVQTKHYDEAKAMLAPGISGDADAELPKMQAVVDHGAPQSFEAIGSNINYFQPVGGPSYKLSDLTYQIHFNDGWVAAEIIVRSSNGARSITSAHFNSLSDSLEVLNRFSLKNKTLIHYLFFAACILIPIFVFATAVVCIFSGVRRRWLWLIFILLPLVQFQLNWTTGEGNVQLLAFVLLGSACYRFGLYGPWVLKFAIPIGAIVFLAVRGRLRRKNEPPPLPAAVV